MTLHLPTPRALLLGLACLLGVLSGCDTGEPVVTPVQPERPAVSYIPLTNVLSLEAVTAVFEESSDEVDLVGMKYYGGGLSGTKSFLATPDLSSADRVRSFPAWASEQMGARLAHEREVVVREFGTAGRAEFLADGHLRRLALSVGQMAEGRARMSARLRASGPLVYALVVAGSPGAVDAVAADLDATAYHPGEVGDGSPDVSLYPQAMVDDVVARQQREAAAFEALAAMTDEEASAFYDDTRALFLSAYGVELPE